MIENKEDYKEFLKYEVLKYNCGGGKYYLKYLAGSENAVIWNWQKRLRKTEYLYNTEKRLRYSISKVILNHKSNRYGLHIGINTFDKGLRIMHLGSILVNGRVRVGKDCKVHINTSFVAQGTSDKTPKIGDDVVVGVGATILGGVEIANGIAIGANAVVCKSFFEENITIAGVPAMKVSDNGSNQWSRKCTHFPSH